MKVIKVHHQGHRSSTVSPFPVPSLLAASVFLRDRLHVELTAVLDEVISPCEALIALADAVLPWTVDEARLMRRPVVTSHVGFAGERPKRPAELVSASRVFTV